MAQRPDLEVASDLPGRVRIRLPSGWSGSEVEHRVRELPGVTACRWTARTRSLLVTYRPGDDTRSGLLAAVRQLEPAAAGTPLPPDGPIAGDTLIMVAPPGGAPGPPGVVRAISGMLAEADAAVGRATAGALDLRTGVPLALGVWAALEMVRGRVGPLAWSTALWYAHGLLRDYALPADRDRS